MAPKDSEGADDALKRIVEAFRKVMSTALTAIAQTPSDQLGAMLPDEFVKKFCQPILTVWGISVSDSQIRKKQLLRYYSLEERKGEFLPIVKMAEITVDSIISIHLGALDEVYEYTLDIIFVVDHAGIASMIDVNLDNMEPRIDQPGEAMVAQTQGVVSYGETVTGMSFEGVVAEFIKKMLGL